MFKKAAIALGLTLGSSLAMAQSTAQYEVTITNITPGQTFTPQMVVTHDVNFRIFALGEEASPGLEVLAEGGDTAPLIDEAANATYEAVTIGGLLGPGESTTTTISGNPDGFISIAAMLIPTNDTFFALSRAPLPEEGGFGRLLRAYDASTEYNDQSCQHIPGPLCGGEDVSEPADNVEGFVRISNGFHEPGDEDSDGYEVLGPQIYDWRNSVARVVVRRIN